MPNHAIGLAIPRRRSVWLSHESDAEKSGERLRAAALHAQGLHFLRGIKVDGVGIGVGHAYASDRTSEVGIGQTEPDNISPRRLSAT